MSKKIFISYSHAQRDWVVDRLASSLRAGGAEVLIDLERFRPGKGLVGQMDEAQDEADIHVLVLSPEYLASDPCRHEMARAIAGGIERLHAETAGWPHLLQLAARTVVNPINKDGRRRADAELLERALTITVKDGEAAFLEILKNESRLPGEWEYLLGFRDRNSQQPPSDAMIARSLRRRLVVETGRTWRLKAPLMARWLRAYVGEGTG